MYDVYSVATQKHGVEYKFVFQQSNEYGRAQTSGRCRVPNTADFLQAPSKSKNVGLGGGADHIYIYIYLNIYIYIFFSAIHIYICSIQYTYIYIFIHVNSTMDSTQELLKVVPVQALVPRLP